MHYNKYDDSYLIRRAFLRNREVYMQIKRIGINEAKTGMLVAEDVFNDGGQLLFPAEARLTEKAITRMRFHSIPFIKIYPEGSGTDINDGVDELSFFEKLRETEEYVAFNENFSEVASVFEKEMRVIIREGGNVTDSTTLSNGVKKILGTCRSGIQVFDLLHCTRTYDEVVFAHSLNVAIISAVLGGWLGFTTSEINTLIVCGIYHDIGKLKIPRKIIEKPEALTPEEYEIMKTHTTLGFKILEDMKLDKRVKYTALMHHERMDGSGYPLGIKGDKIDKLTRVVAIADVYEAMTAPRKYRKARCPFEAVKIFESNGLALYDTEYLLKFLEHITMCYMGYRVRLNDGTIGTIVYMNKQEESRPMIRVGNEYINLFRNPELYIEEIL